MKTRFNSLDLFIEIRELNNSILGYRVQQVYDVDSKTYLIKLNGSEPGQKFVLLLESGNRVHGTSFDWPKNSSPSGFSMKLRKHIKNKRLESIIQLGNADRIVDFTFGSGEAAYHLILELYDRGNLVLTDHQYKILNILRPRIDKELEKFKVKEIYPIQNLKSTEKGELTEEGLKEILGKSKGTDLLKRILTPHFVYGPTLLEHLLLTHNFSIKTKDFDYDRLHELVNIINDGPGQFFVDSEASREGIILQKSEKRAEGSEELLTYLEFHPYLLEQHKKLDDKLVKRFSNFNDAVDEFYSKIESQKIDLKAVAQEKQALKKLENVKKDLSQRLDKLKETQDKDRVKGELIELNEKLVDHALTVIRSAIANQIDWKEIHELIKEAQENGDLVASKITGLKLQKNHFSMKLSNPYENQDENNPEIEVDIDIDLSAQANARKFYVQKKSAAIKERKTVESQSIALKSAERRTKQALKEVATITNINKARKVYWFEKFFWFISSENYLVISGRDMQQNELLVKRYMRANDLYVHADLHGASSVIIKNKSGGGPIPPKTLNEAGGMAVSYSAAWDSKMMTNAWWVYSNQVSKTAPSGEYLTAGSFMIRGKKNFLPPCHLILGFGFLFKLEEGSIDRHKDERKIRYDENEESELQEISKDEEIEIKDEDNGEEEEDDDQKIQTPILEEIKEEVEEKNDPVDKPEIVPSSGDSKHNSEGEREDEPADESEFPDTNLAIGYSATGQMKIKTQTSQDSTLNENVSFDMNKNKENPISDKNKDSNPLKNQQPKRGKHGKMKKIKEKYKDQDEEDKELMMQLLQGRTKEGTSKKREKKLAQQEKERAKKEAQARFKERQQQKQKQQEQSNKKSTPAAENMSVDENGDNDDDNAVKANVSDEIDMLDSLTGIPVIEDELLFCLPVVAPYNVMTNYKFKVKVTPGTGKRGKATKTALNMFINDKNCSQREKDLFKSVKDQDLARNLPGKVKLSAPHLQKSKQKGKK